MIRPIPTDSFQTFIAWNSLNLFTELQDPRWEVVTYADARQVPVSPTTNPQEVEIMGTLLSHPIDTNVSVSVRLEGRVADDAAGQFTILRVEEVDQRKVVGDEEVVSVNIAPVMVPGTSAPATITEPPLTPTKAGLLSPIALAGLLMALAVLGRRIR